MTGRTTTTFTGTNTYHVTAKRWKHGWELHIDGVGVTQSRTLDTAEQMVRDYIETLTDKDVSGDTVVITPDLGELDRKVATVRELLAAAVVLVRVSVKVSVPLADGVVHGKT